MVDRRQADAAGPIDEGTLAEVLESTGGDRAFLEELIGTYLDDATRQVSALRRAASAGLTDDLARAAHALKGASASLGARVLAERSRLLEVDAREGRLDDAAGAIDGIETELARVAAAFRSR